MNTQEQNDNRQLALRLLRQFRRTPAILENELNKHRTKVNRVTAILGANVYKAETWIYGVAERSNGDEVPFSFRVSYCPGETPDHYKTVIWTIQPAHYQLLKGQE